MTCTASAAIGSVLLYACRESGDGHRCGVAARPRSAVQNTSFILKHVGTKWMSGGVNRGTEKKNPDKVQTPTKKDISSPFTPQCPRKTKTRRRVGIYVDPGGLSPPQLFGVVF